MHLAEVKVDMAFGVFRPTHMLAAHNVERMINTILVGGRSLEGSTGTPNASLGGVHPRARRETA